MEPNVPISRTDPLSSNVQPRSALAMRGQTWQSPDWIANPMSTSAGKSLLSRLVRRGLAGQLKMAALLFLPAGSLKFWPGWAYLVAGLLSELRSNYYFYQHDPQLLERRLLKKETIGEQKLIQRLWRVLAALFLMLAGGDYRFGWSRRLLGPVPWWLTVLALLFILGGYTLVFQVLKANRFAASVVQVEAGQAVAATGPYRFVRHPFYSATLVIWLCSPLALGSFVVVPVSFLIIPILVFRLRNEEKILHRDLPGYVEYCQRTRYRLVPFVW
jgi:protein-S-isoprenylcysteine O-methyltransferase Ste14